MTFYLLDTNKVINLNQTHNKNKQTLCKKIYMKEKWVIPPASFCYLRYTMKKYKTSNWK